MIIILIDKIDTYDLGQTLFVVMPLLISDGDWFGLFVGV